MEHNAIKVQNALESIMLNISMQTETYTHTHTHIYIYIYIHRYIQSFPSGSTVQTPPPIREIQETLVIYSP